ncbi:hypothetical protein QM467_15900 [Rhodoblastus sp. 17X3]|uniref:hypothetical protein n=1 Tax=Rhodoblastus sp. 17X3 TaxID=3047026 RepID=UPI0024B70B93|nr:hypothetical protein [Rhodoblastus sp. 17X3]MDI9849539.1 hypothetical protein [Rhodoblastus sp. 17X3]
MRQENTKKCDTAQAERHLEGAELVIGDANAASGMAADGFSTFRLLMPRCAGCWRPRVFGAASRPGWIPAFLLPEPRPAVLDDRRIVSATSLFRPALARIAATAEGFPTTDDDRVDILLENLIRILRQGRRQRFREMVRSAIHRYFFQQENLGFRESVGKPISRRRRSARWRCRRIRPKACRCWKTIATSVRLRHFLADRNRQPRLLVDGTALLAG